MKGDDGSVIAFARELIVFERKSSFRIVPHETLTALGGANGLRDERTRNRGRSERQRGRCFEGIKEIVDETASIFNLEIIDKGRIGAIPLIRSDIKVTRRKAEHLGIKVVIHSIGTKKDDVICVTKDAINVEITEIRRSFNKGSNSSSTICGVC